MGSIFPSGAQLKSCIPETAADIAVDSLCWDTLKRVFILLKRYHAAVFSTAEIEQ